jgi:hypothetical protein
VPVCNLKVGGKILFSLEDGGSTVLRNCGIQPPHYTAQQPRKPRILFSLPGKPEISKFNFCLFRYNITRGLHDTETKLSIVWKSFTVQKIGKGKVSPVLFLTEYHAMNAYWRVEV